jgi:LAS superfamily LD-carboxypeptidase LdcB
MLDPKLLMRYQAPQSNYVASRATTAPPIATAQGNPLVETPQSKLQSYQSMLSSAPTVFTPAANTSSSTIKSLSERFPQNNTASVPAKQNLTYNKNGKKSSGLQPSAYGFHGTTGDASLRGKGARGMQSVFANNLSTMFSAMQAAGLGRPSISDGFRSYAGQVTAKAKKGKLAATPGNSVHGLGLAADLGLNKAQYQWMLRNSREFGIVNLPSESWHWQMDPSRWSGQYDR